jgi:class 3 adenylate cyclase
MAEAGRMLPTGTVTLLFTDIEGSTRLLSTLGDRYAGLLAKQRKALRAMRRTVTPTGISTAYGGLA